MSSGKSSAGQHGLNAVLARFMIKVPDIRFICLSTTDGAELLSEMRHGVLMDDAQLVMNLVPSFTVSWEQASRLDMGTPVTTMTWLPSCIVLQTMIESFVLTIILEEVANLGIMEEHLSPLQEILRPFCTSAIEAI